MILHVLPTVIFIYLLLRFVLPSGLRPAGKVVLTLIIFVCVQEHLWLRLFFGGLAASSLPSAGMLLMGCGFVWAVLLFAFTLLVDLGKLLRWVWRLCRRQRDKIRRSTRTLSRVHSPGRRKLILAAALAVPAAYGVRCAAQLPQVVNHSIGLPKLPPALNGLRLVQITDLHASEIYQAEWVSALVERVNALRPDLIVLTGDLVDGSLRRRGGDVQPLRDLQAKYGVYGCTGNHEYYSGYSDWMKRFADLGIKMLSNTHARLEINGASLALLGLTDAAASGFNLPGPNLQAAMQGLPEGIFKLLLEHRPGNALARAAAGVDLQLSGHTHGGHILGLNLLVGRFNSGFSYGWYRAGKMPLYVSSGAGLWAGFPVRLGVPSELLHLTLRSGRA